MVTIEWPPPRALMVAELSANHLGSLDRMQRLIDLACASGADAIKTQCWYPGDMAAPGQRCESGPWAGQLLTELYEQCRVPMKWHETLKRTANDLGLPYFASPFSVRAVDFLEALDVPAYKVASFEVDHVPLLERIAETGKPCMYSLGTATGRDEDRVADMTTDLLTLDQTLPWLPLFCVSAYPAAPREYPLNRLRARWTFDKAFGLSDHTLGHTVAVAATALGARVIEKHFTDRRSAGGPDASFSAEPAEFAAMVEAVRVVEAALEPSPDPAPHQLRRGLWVTRDAVAGDVVDETNVGILRPRAALTPVDWAGMSGKRFRRGVRAGAALQEEDVL